MNTEKLKRKKIHKIYFNKRKKADEYKSYFLNLSYFLLKYVCSMSFRAIVEHNRIKIESDRKRNALVELKFNLDVN